MTSAPPAHPARRDRDGYWTDADTLAVIVTGLPAALAPALGQTLWLLGIVLAGLTLWFTEPDRSGDHEGTARPTGPAGPAQL